LALEGKFSDAIAQYDDAVRVLREVHDAFELEMALLELGDARLEQGNVAEARRSFEEVRDIDHRSGGFARADLDLAFARLALAASQPEQAAPLARSALNTFAAAGREGDRTEAAALLARVLIAGGNAKDASAVLAAIPSPEGKALPIAAVVQFRIARCLVEANAGRRAEAAQGMERIAAEVARLGLPPLAHETRLARAAVMKTADTTRHDLRQ
jgi:tetratricopeptide (TPR) repeat protein